MTARFAVYKATNQVNGRAYIGITTRSVAVRWGQHVRAARSGMKYPFYSALRKYGTDAFRLEVIRQCSSLAELEQAEIELIQAHGTHQPKGYNATLGGRTNLGRRCTAEQRAAKAIQLKRIHAADPSIRARISASRTGRFAGENSHWFGKRHSEETRRRQSAAQAARHADPRARQRMSEGCREMHGDPARHAAWLQKVRETNARRREPS